MGNLSRLFFNQTSKFNITSTPSDISSSRDYTVTSNNGTVTLQNVSPEKVSFGFDDQNNQIITYYAEDIIVNAAMSLEDISLAEFIRFVSSKDINANTVISGKIHTYDNGTVELGDSVLPVAEILIIGDNSLSITTVSAFSNDKSSHTLGAEDNEYSFELRNFVLPAAEIVICGDKLEFGTTVSTSCSEKAPYELGSDDNEYLFREQEYSLYSPFSINNIIL